MVQKIRSVVADLVPLRVGREVRQMRMGERVASDLVSVSREILDLAPRHVVVTRGGGNEAAVDVEGAPHAVRRQRPPGRVLRLTTVVERQRHDRLVRRGRDRRRSNQREGNRADDDQQAGDEKPDSRGRFGTTSSPRPGCRRTSPQCRSLPRSLSELLARL